MKISKAVKDFFFFGSLYYTAITSALLLLAIGNANKAPDTERFFLVLMLSFIFGLAAAIYRIDGMSRPLAISLHAAIYNLGFLLFMALCGMGFEKSIIGTLVFAVVYTVVTVVYRLVTKVMKKSSSAAKTGSAVAATTSKKEKKSDKQEKTEYKNLFS